MRKALLMLVPISMIVIGILLRKPFASSPPPAETAEPAAEATAAPESWPGRTQPASGRSARIAPRILGCVTEVLVAPGDRVSRNQPLVKLADERPCLELRLRRARVAELEARRNRLLAQSSEEFNNKGPVMLSPKLAELEASLAAAVEEVKLAELTLEEHTIRAAINGVVSTLQVTPGTVVSPGSPAWGEIIDPSELEVLCEVTPAQASRLAPGQAVRVFPNRSPEGSSPGAIVSVGIVADRRSGQVTVVIRLNNSQDQFRCYQPARVERENPGEPGQATAFLLREGAVRAFTSD